MKVTAILIGAHRALLPAGARQGGRVTLQYEREAVTLAQVMQDLAMPSDTPRVVFLDGEVIETDHRLRDGDTVSFVSPMGGG